MPFPVVALGAVSTLSTMLTGMRDAVRTCSCNKASCTELIARCERLVQFILANPRSVHSTPLAFTHSLALFVNWNYVYTPLNCKRNPEALQDQQTPGTVSLRLALFVYHMIN